MLAFAHCSYMSTAQVMQVGHVSLRRDTGATVTATLLSTRDHQQRQNVAAYDYVTGSNGRSQPIDCLGTRTHICLQYTATVRSPVCDWYNYWRCQSLYRRSLRGKVEFDRRRAGRTCRALWFKQAVLLWTFFRIIAWVLPPVPSSLVTMTLSWWHW